MGPDLVDYALDTMTDSRGFEKLAAEIMMLEGYPTIEPLGGVHDQGEDARAAGLFYANRPVHTVFQFTLQEDLAGKIDATCLRLKESGVAFGELVIVTSRPISAERRRKLEGRVRQSCGTPARIVERDTLRTRLADLSNGLWKRYFADVKVQVELLTAVGDSGLKVSGDLEAGLLRSCIALTFGHQSAQVRDSVFDHLVLCLCSQRPGGASGEDLRMMYASMFKKGAPQVEQFSAALGRLESSAVVRVDAGKAMIRPAGVEFLVGSGARAKAQTAALVDDIIGHVEEIVEEAATHRGRMLMDRNTRQVLCKLFQLQGLEIANQALASSESKPVYLDARQELVETASCGLDPAVGEVLVAAIAEVLHQPSPQQAETLANWSRAFLGVQIMNLDPTLRQLQLTRFRSKVFVLDTDFVLDALIAESPLCQPFRRLLSRLCTIGCRVIVPTTVVEEVVTHARISPRTAKYFHNSLQ